MGKGSKKKHAHDHPEYARTEETKKDTESADKFNNKVYERELFKLQTELVKLRSG